MMKSSERNKKFSIRGTRVLVKPFKLMEVDEVYKRSMAAGIVFAETDELRREKAALDKGVVVGVGTLAWYDWGDGTPWAKVGDEVVWARHSGRVVQKNGDDVLVAVNDEDIIGVFEEETHE